MNRLAASPPLPPHVLSEVVDWAITTRRSIRAFLPTPVPREEVEAILRVARTSASGVNTQPWRVHVVSGEAKQRLSEAITRIDNDPVLSAQLQEPYDYYPSEWTSPFIDRRRKVGWDLYGDNTVHVFATRSAAGRHESRRRDPERPKRFAQG